VLKIWDFQGTLIRPEPFSFNGLIRTISHLNAIPGGASAKPSVVSSKVETIVARQETTRVASAISKEYVGPSCMVADELQMILVSHSEDGSSYLHVESFLNAAQ
jgi:hypothetical protein